MFKIFFDFIVSLIILIILSPLFLIISIIILLESGFPVFHKRKVHLNDKETFNFFKFRTMQLNADIILQSLLENNKEIRDEYDKFFKIKNDPRITKSGKFLRKTSLDELPQIFNVLMMQMSLVGPRPKTPDELKKFFQNSDYQTLFSVKPGITCTWQVSGRSNISYSERRKLDLDYARNRNFFLDLRILFMTIFVPFKRNAY